MCDVSDSIRVSFDSGNLVCIQMKANRTSAAKLFLFEYPV
jgi:hypothetical protein